MLENQAKFNLKEGQNEAQEDVFQTDKEVVWLHGHADNPEATADIIISDMNGNPQHIEKDVKFVGNNFGKRIDLQLNDNRCIVKLENVKNAKKFDIFIE